MNFLVFLPIHVSFSNIVHSIGFPHFPNQFFLTKYNLWNIHPLSITAIFQNRYILFDLMGYSRWMIILSPPSIFYSQFRMRWLFLFLYHSPFRVRTFNIHRYLFRFRPILLDSGTFWELIIKEKKRCFFNEK